MKSIRFDKQRNLLEVSSTTTYVMPFILFFGFKYFVEAIYEVYPSLKDNASLSFFECFAISISGMVPGWYLGRFIAVWKYCKTCSHVDLAEEN